MRRPVDARRSLRALVALLALACSGVADAGCTVWAMPIPVGEYDASSAEAVITSADIELRCDEGEARFNLAFGPSSVSGSIVDRRMRHAFRPDTLRYNLYHDQHVVRLWGDSDATMSSGVAVGGLALVRVFVRIDPGQDAWVGEYSDEVVLTVLP